MPPSAPHAAGLWADAIAARRRKLGHGALAAHRSDDEPVADSGFDRREERRGGVQCRGYCLVQCPE